MEKYLASLKGNVPPGMYFFNNEGNECGGLIYSGERNEDGSYYAGGLLSFDQYRQDQVIFIQHEDTNGRHSASLNILDRPELPINEWGEEFQRLSNLPEGPEKEAALKRLRSRKLSCAASFCRQKRINLLL